MKFLLQPKPFITARTRDAMVWGETNQGPRMLPVRRHFVPPTKDPESYFSDEASRLYVLYVCIMHRAEILGSSAPPGTLRPLQGPDDRHAVA